MKQPSKLLTIFTSLCLSLTLLTAAIAVPILCRPFYYSQIKALELVKASGFSEGVIRGAFDEVMDYLVFNRPFGTGELRWSEEGMAHFADCKRLFQLDFIVLAAAGAFLLLVFLVLRQQRDFHRFLGRGPCFWAFMGMLLILGGLALWAVLDFGSLFTAFHRLFFPGKTNWTFDPRLDEIILILPEAFWARAAALTAGLALGGGLLLTILEAILSRRPKYKNIYEELKHR